MWAMAIDRDSIPTIVFIYFVSLQHVRSFVKKVGEVSREECVATGVSPSPLGTPQKNKVPRFISTRFLCTCLFVRAGGGSREPWYDGPRPIPAVLTSVPFAVFHNVVVM